jgi:hypothetical protein
MSDRGQKNGGDTGVTNMKDDEHLPELPGGAVVLEQDGKRETFDLMDILEEQFSIAFEALEGEIAELKGRCDDLEGQVRYLSYQIERD